MPNPYNVTDVNDLPPGVTLDDISPYGYVPTRIIVFSFLFVFVISAATHLTQALYFKLWFLLPTAVLCGVGEIVGWTGRLMSSTNVLNHNGFLIQITTTIIAPTPLIAANFIMLGRIIARLGPGYSRLSQEWYTRIFLSCDLVALVMQGVGGGIASSATTDSGSTLGSNIMLAGIIFQLVGIIVYTCLAAEFLWHYGQDMPFRRAYVYMHRSKTPRRIKIMLMGMSFMTVLLLIRSIYRTAELADGWHGKIITTEWLFDVFDGLMIVSAMLTLNVIHPGFYLVPEEVPVEVALKMNPKAGSASTNNMLEHQGKIVPV
ncbi:RTA1-domain-containing protein [Peniophora sp. CONT]|nr:RTA1-domain-containing protein [Peniophora sp. CONT]